MIYAILRNALLCAAVLWGAATSVNAQQAVLPADALATAERILAAQSRAVGIEGLLPLISAALDNMTEARGLDPATKSGIVANVAKAIAPRVPTLGRDVATMYANGMSIEDMKAVTAYLEGPIPKRAVAIASKLRPELGKSLDPAKSPELSSEMAAAADEMMKFVATPAGEKFFKIPLANMEVFNRAGMQMMMATTTLINDELGNELKKRGMRR